LLEENLQDIKTQGFVRLKVNCLEMRAQVHIFTEDFAAAREDLNAAAQLANAERTQESFLVKKWSAIMSALEKRDTRPLLAFRKEAEARGDWEFVREADRYLVQVDFDRQRFDRLIFGTPFPRYRERVLKLTGQKTSSANYIFGNEGGVIL